jgi:uncharacterized protein (TIGR02596 family)
VELLVVILIAALLLAASTLSLGRTLAAQQLSASTGRFVNEMAYAAQLAAKENRLVGVRFLERGDEIDKDIKRLQGWQLLAPDRTTGKWKPLGEVNFLDASVMMMDQADYSTVLQLSPLTTPSAVDDVDTTPPLFAFTPQGSTTLARGGSEKWSLSFALVVDAERTPGELPANWRTLVVNPYTGAVVLY